MSIEEQIAREAFEKLSNSEWKDGVSIILEAIKRAVAIEREIVAIDANPLPRYKRVFEEKS